MARALHVVVVGGSAGGLFTSLLLARVGHTVTVLEQERLEIASDVECAARSAYRLSAPHIVQPHALLARCRQLFLRWLPDIYAQMLAAGVSESPLSTQMPASLRDTCAMPGDEQLTLLMTRRATVDWVLRRAAATEPGVEIRSGVRVSGLLARPGKPPHVTGVQTTEGNVSADLVVDAAGYRSAIDHWLADIHAPPTWTLRAECGVTYFSRQYRLRSGANPPGPPTTRVVVGLNEFTVGIWGGDNGTMQVAVIPLAQDKRFSRLRYPEVFEAVLRSIPFYAQWLDVLEPTTEIFVMGAVQNTLRRFVVDGSPVVTGVVAVGDSLCTTNPTLGRGLSFTLCIAANLPGVIERNADDAPAQMLAIDGIVTEEILPFYQDQVATDKERLAMLRHTIFDAPAPEPAAAALDRVTYAQLRTAALFDPIAFRAFWKIMGMVVRPEEVYTDPEVVSRTRAAIQRQGNRPSMLQPTRNELLAALATPAS